MHDKTLRPLAGGTRFALKALALCSTALMLTPPATAGESTEAPEVVIITERPPDPVGNAAFSATLLDQQQLQI